MMRKILLASVVAAAVALPAPRSPCHDGDTRSPTAQSDPNPRISARRPVARARNTGTASASIGSGMVGGNEPGHVDRPGATGSTRRRAAPLNDVQPGRGTNDAPQSKNPKPMH